MFVIRSSAEHHHFFFYSCHLLDYEMEIFCIVFAKDKSNYNNDHIMSFRFLNRTQMVVIHMGLGTHVPHDPNDITPR
jgi:hypothetical protein